MENIATKTFVENREIAWEPTAPGMKRKIMAYDEHLMVVKVAFDKGGIGKVHSHHHTQITHVESGKFEVMIGGETKILSAGDAFYVPPHAEHGAVCLEAGVLIDTFSPVREDFLQQREP